MLSNGTQKMCRKYFMSIDHQNELGSPILCVSHAFVPQGQQKTNLWYVLVPNDQQNQF